MKKMCSRGFRTGPRGCPGVPRRDQRGEKGAQRAPKRAQRAPIRAHGDPFGDQMGQNFMIICKIRCQISKILENGNH